MSVDDKISDYDRALEIGKKLKIEEGERFVLVTQALSAMNDKLGGGLSTRKL